MGRILLADSSTTSRLMVVKDLEEDGHNVEETTSGREAVDICISAPPDCLILELVLYDMDGFKVLKALKEKGIDVPAVVLTDLRMRSVEEKCAELGVAAYFKKPMSSVTLKQKIAEIITARSRPAGGQGVTSPGSKPTANT